MTQKLESVIGLEIHLQLKVRSKMFSPAPNAEAERPNSNINVIDLGHPGVLPLVNAEAVHKAALLAMSLEMNVHPWSSFDRKHYFYPDLPKGYQITQYDHPIATEGTLTLLMMENGEPVERTIRFERLHLEEDAAKSFHLEHGEEGITGSTAIDFNRAGTALAEIVTKPDFRTPAEAKAFLEELQRYCRYVGASDADMEKGHLRVDANVSLRPMGSEELYPKTEVKNMNSFRAVERALLYQIEEQTKLWEEGKRPDKTRTVGWRDAEGVTVLQRVKEGATDYRYFPEPDVTPVVLSQDTLDAWRSELPELPGDKRKRFIREYDLKVSAVNQLVTDQKLADYFEEAVSETDDVLDEFADGIDKTRAVAKLVFGWITSELLKLLNTEKKSIAECSLEPHRFADLMGMLFRKQINSTNAQKVLAELYKSKATLETVMAAGDYALKTDSIDVPSVVAGVLARNPKEVESYRAGKKPLLQFLLGQVMKETKGQADPVVLREELERQLGE